MIFLYYIIAPVVLGTAFDLGFNNLLGSQMCSFDGEDKICTIFGKKINGWQREIGRSILQLLLVFAILYYIKPYFKTGLFPIVGLGIFLVSQPELFEDFRRFINTMLFNLKHKNA